jgi:hypothetical protein
MKDFRFIAIAAVTIVVATTGPAWAQVAVPEPASFGLLGTAIGGLAIALFLRRK